jgi:predicted DNA-binding transcriptional regulator AlpA
MKSGDCLKSVKWVAERLGICSRGVWRLVARGELPQPVHVGRASRRYVSDVEDFMRKLGEGS